jgi:hypothetical protein
LDAALRVAVTLFRFDGENHESARQKASVLARTKALYVEKAAWKAAVAAAPD